MFYRPSRYVCLCPRFDGTRSLTLSPLSTHLSVVLLVRGCPPFVIIHATILGPLPVPSPPPFPYVLVLDLERRKQIFVDARSSHVSIYEPTTWPFLILHPSLIFRGCFLFSFLCTDDIVVGRFLSSSWWIDIVLELPFLSSFLFFFSFSWESCLVSISLSPSTDL